MPICTIAKRSTRQTRQTRQTPALHASHSRSSTSRPRPFVRAHSPPQALAPLPRGFCPFCNMPVLLRRHAARANGVTAATVDNRDMMENSQDDHETANGSAHCESFMPLCMLEASSLSCLFRPYMACLAAADCHQAQRCHVPIMQTYAATKPPHLLNDRRLVLS